MLNLVSVGLSYVVLKTRFGFSSVCKEEPLKLFEKGDFVITAVLLKITQ